MLAAVALAVNIAWQTLFALRAAELFDQALPSVEAFRSPRAWAFTLLGIDAICVCHPKDPFRERMRGILAEKLLAAAIAVETDD